MLDLGAFLFGGFQPIRVEDDVSEAKSCGSNAGPGPGPGS